MRIKFNFSDNQKFTHVSHISGENQFSEKTYRTILPKTNLQKIILFYRTQSNVVYYLIKQIYRKTYRKEGKLTKNNSETKLRVVHLVYQAGIFFFPFIGKFNLNVRYHNHLGLILPTIFFQEFGSNF